MIQARDGERDGGGAEALHSRSDQASRGGYHGFPLEMAVRRGVTPKKRVERKLPYVR